MNDYDIGKIYREMELHLIRSMKRNLGKHLKDEIAEGMEWKMWQSEKLKELKRYQRQNKDIIKAYTSGLDKDIADILKEEFKQGHKSEINKYNKLFDKKVSDSFFKLNDRKANALIKVVNDDLETANTAALRMMNDTYRQTIHKAATFASNGVMTQKQAVDMATRDFLSRGLAVIEYKDGKRVNIASYAQMATRTASQRAMLMGEGEFRKSIGETLIIISKHGTACKLCQPHESQVYIDDVYSGGKPDGKHKLLSDAMDQGLFHPNCRHGVSTYYGLDDEEEETTVNVPKENNDEKESYLDREIQKEKRKVTGFQSPDNLKTAQQRLKQLELEKTEYNTFNYDKVLKTYTGNEKLVRDAFDNANLDNTTYRILNNVDKLDNVEIVKGKKTNFSIGISNNEISMSSLKDVKSFYHEWTHSIDYMAAYKKNYSTLGKDFKWISENLQETRMAIVNKLNNTIPQNLADELAKQRANIKAKLEEKMIRSGKLNELVKKTIDKQYKTNWGKMSDNMKKYVIDDISKKEMTKALNKIMDEDIEYKRWGCLSDIYDAITSGSAKNVEVLTGKHGAAYYSDMSLVRLTKTGVVHRENTEMLANFGEMKLGGYTKQLNWLKDNDKELYSKLEETFKEIADVMEGL